MLEVNNEKFDVADLTDAQIKKLRDTESSINLEGKDKSIILLAVKRLS